MFKNVSERCNDMHGGNNLPEMKGWTEYELCMNTIWQLKQTSNRLVEKCNFNLTENRWYPMTIDSFVKCEPIARRHTGEIEKFIIGWKIVSSYLQKAHLIGWWIIYFNSYCIVDGPWKQKHATDARPANLITPRYRWLVNFQYTSIRCQH